jgi:hypothetical protein
MDDPASYPEWFYYPSRTRPSDWVRELLEIVAAARPLIDSATVDGLTSDKVLAHLRPGLLKLGYEVEGGKHRAVSIGPRRSGGQCCSATKGASASPTRSTPSRTSWVS